MISKFRNRAILWFTFATVLSAAFGVAFVNPGKMSHDNWWVLMMFLYLGAVSLWMVGCFNLAKAKGYSDDRVGGMFLLLFVVGCVIPFAPCIFPLGILFLKDQTRRRVYNRRYDDAAS